jgi:FlaA1/EpsC-like NDP-sugar epimerase
VLVLPLALWSAIVLRLGELPLSDPPPWWAYALTIVVAVPVFLRMGLYRAVIRYLETKAFTAVIGAAVLASAIFAAVVIVFRVDGIPVTALVIYAVLSSGYAGLARLLARQLLRSARSSEKRYRRAAIYGAGEAGRQLVQAMRAGAGYRPVVFVDDNPALHRRELMGLPVHSSLDLPALVGSLGLEAVIVAIPSLTPGQRAQLLRRLEPLNLDVRLVPGVAELLRGDIDVADVREVHAEDLLGRDPVQLDDVALLEFLGGRVVLVTGAGGSIGSELCRQITRFKPSRLVLMEISEFALYALREELVVRFPNLVCAIGDVKDESRVTQIIREYRPTLVFHAAAYKHVPLMEEVNAWEAVRNNTLGTLTVTRAAMVGGVEKFVLVSTDKAVNPTNVMGASKRLAEMVCQALHAEGRTRFEIVRFGNVLGSSGSVIPKFRQQIAAGGPITVTHPDIVRYFMSIPEAAQLVLQAACMGQGGEVFVLDMGEPVRIVDLARNLIRLSGLREDRIGIEFTGLRPGEKLYEELLTDSEFTRPTHHPKIRIAKVAEVSPHLCEDVWRWLGGKSCVGDEEVRRSLSQLLPEYRPWTSGAPGAVPASLEEGRSAERQPGQVLL